MKYISSAIGGKQLKGLSELPASGQKPILVNEIGQMLLGSSNITSDETQGYYGVITEYYNPVGSNIKQDLEGDVWQPLVAKPYILADACPTDSAGPQSNLQGTFGSGSRDLLADQVVESYTDTSQHRHNLIYNPAGTVQLGSETNGLSDGIYDKDRGLFCVGGSNSGSYGQVRILVHCSPDVDESQLSVRLNFVTNLATYSLGSLTSFTTETVAISMDQGADTVYEQETLLSFFAGDTLFGNNWDDAGLFSIDAKCTVDAEIELLALTYFIQQ